MSDLNDRLATLTRLYVDRLGRLPDPQGFHENFASECSLDELAARFVGGDEFRHVEAAVAAMRRRLEPFATMRRVLLFGAFGNGNLGDRIMAQTVAARLERSGDTVCFAYSGLHSADYPFPTGRQLAHADMPLNIRIMALFDALVIGGGGLLAYTHEPLWDRAWPYTVPIPYGILGCGVRIPLDDRLHNLVRDAAAISARDKPGWRELKRTRADALLCADPVLAFHATKRTPGRGTGRRLYVPRAPACGWHERLKAHIRPIDQVMVFEAHIDHALISTFANVVAINSADQFVELAADFDVVISERYHGAILALLAGIPAFGICRDLHSDKLTALFEALGLADKLVTADDAGTDFTPYPVADAVARIDAMRAKADTAYDTFLSRLFDRTATDRPRDRNPAPPRDDLPAVRARRRAARSEATDPTSTRDPARTGPGRERETEPTSPTLVEQVQASLADHKRGLHAIEQAANR